MTREELSHQHDHGQTKGMATRRRSQRRVGADLRQVGCGLVAQPSNTGARPALAERSTLAGRGRERPDGAELPGQCGEPARQRRHPGVSSPGERVGLGAQLAHLPRERRCGATVTLDRACG